MVGGITWVAMFCIEESGRRGGEASCGICCSGSDDGDTGNGMAESKSRDAEGEVEGEGGLSVIVPEV